MVGTEELKLGSLNGEHDAYVQISQVRTDGEGRIYVLDVRFPALRIFDRTGRFIRQIGTAGDGPGEYRFPGPFGLIADTIWIAENRTGRVSLFDLDGTLLRTISLVSNRQRVAPIGVLGADEFLVVTRSGMSDLNRLPVGKVFYEQSIVRRNRAGTVRDTVVTSRVEPGLLITRTGGSMMIYEPIDSLPLVRYLHERDEIIEVVRPIAEAADSGAFRIRMRTRARRVQQDRRFVYRPLPIPETFRDSLRADIRRRVQGTSRSEEQEEIALEHLEVPRFLTPVSAIRRPADGTIWLRRESHTGIAGGKYLVLDAELPLANLELPANARLGIIGLDHVWLILEDEFDVQYLARYPIVRE